MMFWKLINFKSNTRKREKQNIIMLKRFVATNPWMPIKYLIPYEQKRIENKWKQTVISCIAENQETVERSGLKKKYILSMFPYPSGKLHLGHVRVYTISDAIAQIYRMRGWEVIHPMGWDAFGLPAENAAIDRGENPEEWTQKNIKYMKKQLRDLGCRFDWWREISTCNPKYYKWTQFIFLKLFKAGLVYKQKAIVNWDPVDKTVLADEQVDNEGCSWRSGTKVEKKLLSQWFIKARRLSKELFEDLSDPCLENWRDIASIQKHWIGECNGYIIEMKMLDSNHREIDKLDHLPVWMAHPEHLENIEFLAVKSDHLLSKDIKFVIKKTPQDSTPKEDSTLLNVKAINPISKKLIPLIVNDHLNYEDSGDIYVGIPSLNNEDKRICLDVGLHITPLPPPEVSSSKRIDILTKLRHLNSGGYESSVKLKDWLISRQRYWGTPIPIVYCAGCGTVPVPEEDLPVELPKIKGSIDKGTALLTEIEEWYQCSCPRCGKAAQREADTMDTFVDSSWYFLRYLDPQNTEELIGKDKAQTLMPVDLYIGGKEHATLHLYYARFLCKFLTSIGITSHKEPFKQLLVQGMVKGRSFQVQKTGKYLRPDEVDFSASPHVEKDSRLPLLVRFEKMSKSKYNGVDPQSLMDEYGVDAVRLAMLSNASPQSDRHWDSEDMKRSFQIMEKLWMVARQFVMTRREGGSNLPPISHEKRNNYETEIFEIRNFFLLETSWLMDLSSLFHFHSLIKFVQQMIKSILKVPKNLIFSDEYEKSCRCILVLLSPICPHLTAELWQAINEVSGLHDPKQNDFVWKQPWPTVDPSYKRTLLIAVNKAKEVYEVKLTETEYSTLTQEKALQLAYDNYFTLRDVAVSKITFKYNPDYKATLRLFINKRTK